MKRESKVPQLVLILLLVAGFGLGARLSIWHSEWAGEQGVNRSLTALLLGDSRKLFSNHFFTKADQYFHSGYYPSIFDQSLKSQAITDAAGTTGSAGEDSHVWLDEQTTDWIDRFSRYFYPSEHTHLGQESGHDHDDHEAHDHAGHDHEHDHEHEHEGEEIGEMLPWLRISAELDPTRIETYVVSSYWLRTQMGRVDEAEAFLRDGLRANPKSYAILFELARIYEENRNDPVKAGNLYELALRYWNEQNAGKEERDIFMAAQILAHWARLDEQQGRYQTALDKLRELKSISPNPNSIQLRIEEMEKKIGEGSSQP